MIERIIKSFDPQKIILLGSHARGEENLQSDVDRLVIMPDGIDRRSTAIKIRQKLNDFPISKDIIVTTEDEISRRGDLIGTVLRPALREGQVLYERE